MGTVAGPRVIDAVDRVCRTAGTGDELFAGLSQEVAKGIPFDGAGWFGVDPVTLLAVAPARVEHLDSGYCQVFWHGEFHDQDAALFRDLARSAVPAASLRAATGDRPLRSARYRDYLHPQGYEDELRVAFRTGANTWAIAALYREKGRPPFGTAEVALMAAISDAVGSAVRVRAAMSTPAVPPLSPAPGLMVFDRDGVLASANAEAAWWLDEIYGPGRDHAMRWLDVLRDRSADDLETPIPIIPLVALARAVAVGHEQGQPRLRLRDHAGRWLVLHASCLSGGAADGSVAVVIEPAKSVDVAPIIIEAYGLSSRERDVVRCIARGLSTPDITAELFLSAHTVRDYIKAVFEKVGVRSRGELVAKLFGDHYSDAVHANAVCVK